MRFNKACKTVLKYAQSQAKHTEFGIDEAYWPRFPGEINDLCYESMIIVDDYLQEFLDGWSAGKVPCKDPLAEVASFYEAAASTQPNKIYSDGFWTLATLANFLIENYGSAKVCLRKVNALNHYGRYAQEMLITIDSLLNGPDGDAGRGSLRMRPPYVRTIEPSVYDYIGGKEAKYEVLEESIAASDYKGTDSLDWFFQRALKVIALQGIAGSSRHLLPHLSSVDDEKWAKALADNKALSRMLWPAQTRIGDAGAFNQESAFVQLPTGAGKTKSFELILRARALAGISESAVVIAPLRALCNEIASDLKKALSDVAQVNVAPDTLDLSGWLVSGSMRGKLDVKVCTPEKFAYVVHHSPEILDSIGLVILDEAHLLGDASRGPSYELMLAEMNLRRPDVQKVLMSAVISNAEDVSQWLFGAGDRAVSTDDIPQPEKTIARVARSNSIDFFDRAQLTARKYFIPHAIVPIKLKLFGRESRVRWFPDYGGKDINWSVDVALYLANELSAEGASAIFVPRRSSFPRAYHRIVDLGRRGAALDGLERSVNHGEMAKIDALLALHYGESPYSEGVKSGILPHHAQLPDGIKRAVESAIKRGDARCVICTQTLAQGVNLPIRYLFITGRYTSRSALSVRDFQNLVGRAVRSGAYNEGTVFITDGKAENHIGWREYAKYFDGGALEDCASSILSIAKGFELRGDGITRTVVGDRLVKAIVERSAQDEYIDTIRDEIRRTSKEIDADAAKAQEIAASLTAIESYLASLVDEGKGEEQFDSLCASTFAYASASEEERRLLIRLFRALGKRLLENAPEPARRVCARTQTSSSMAKQLLEWCQTSDGRACLLNEPVDAKALASLFYTFESKATTQVDKNVFLVVLEGWIGGSNYKQISQELEVKGVCADSEVSKVDIEKICSEFVSYEFSHFVGCIADCEDELGGEYLEHQASMLELQSRLKYGVENAAQIAFCEQVLNDRLLGRIVTQMLNIEAAPLLHDTIMRNKTTVKEYLQEYPRFYREEFRRYIYA